MKDKFIKDIFLFLSTCLLLTIALELISPGLVLVYLNPLFILFIWLIMLFYILLKA